jgi:hypothetical protein
LVIIERFKGLKVSLTSTNGLSDLCQKSQKLWKTGYQKQAAKAWKLKEGNCILQQVVFLV